MISLSIKTSWFKQLKSLAKLFTPKEWVILLSVTVGATATVISVLHGYTVAYGDAESHLNIAKRVVDSLTPGFAQLGGIWLPLPHLLMLPFVYFDPLWRTGLAGSIVSGIAFVVASLYLFKTTKLLTGSNAAGFIASLVFISNPNVLYLQTTPMTELVLIVFFVLSNYFFIQFIQDRKNMLALILAALWGFCAVLSRYDAWFLVVVEAGVVVLLYLPWKEIPRRYAEIKSKWDAKLWRQLQGMVLLFVALAFFGVVLWLMWDYLILGDPLYFKNSEFSAQTQQHAWEIRGELPAKHHVFVSLQYYFVTAMSNLGVLVTGLAAAGLWSYLKRKNLKHVYVVFILFVPFVFNVVTLWLGQSVIFIPHITPFTFDWTLFNVRYGVMMAPFAAVFVGYLFWNLKNQGRLFVGVLLLAQIGLYLVGYSKVISMEDGVRGLSSAIAKLPDAQAWIGRNYDDGLVLTDDFARTISIIRSPIPMKNIIYIGNKPYWEESLERPELHAEWVIMQENDSVWNALWANPAGQAHLFKYYVKEYTSPQILIFKRNHNVPVEN